MGVSWTLSVLIFFSSSLSHVTPNPVRNDENKGSLTNNTGKQSENVCTSESCHRTAEEILNYMDKNVDPCDNFYQFVCGNFDGKTTIPQDEIMVDRLSTIRNQLYDQLEEILLEESLPDESNVFRVMKTFYKSCLKEATDNENNVPILLDIIKKAGGWPVFEGDHWDEENFDWLDSLKKLADAGLTVDSLLRVSTTPNSNNTKTIILLNRDENHPYLKASAHDGYLNYVVRVVVALGADRDRAEKELREALSFEKDLKNITFGEIVNLFGAEDTIENLTMEYGSNVPWMKYIQSLLPANIQIDEKQELMIEGLLYFFELPRLLQETPKRIVANYIMYKAAFYAFNFLDDEIHRLKLVPKKTMLYNFTITDTMMRIPWRMKCVDIVSKVMPQPLDVLYIRKYLEEDTKKSVNKIVQNTLKQFRILMQKADWLDNRTREYALDRLDSIRTLVGYYDEDLEIDDLEAIYEGLVLDETNFLHCFLSFNRLLRQSHFKKLSSGSVIKLSSLLYEMRTLATVSFNRIDNEIVIPAGILQGLYKSADPKYLNYAIFGASTGHEVLHGYQNLRLDLKLVEIMENWLVPDETMKKYRAKAQCIINQYGNYTVKEAGLQLNSTKTEVEDVADNSGIKVAYLSYKNWLEHNNGVDLTLPGLPYNSTQMFWITAAHSYCAKFRKDVWNYVISLGKHSPHEFRVIGPFSNMPQFAEDFNCPIGSKMNPKNQCSIW